MKTENKVRLWKDLTDGERKRLFRRSEENIEALLGNAEGILNGIKEGGDIALYDFSRKFDGTPERYPLRVTKEEFCKAKACVSDSLKGAMAKAIENIMAFHQKQKPEAFSFTEIEEGLECGERITPIDSAALYVPRMKGSFPSMLIMLAVPAAIAGVKRVVVTTPPDKDGYGDAATIYAAELCGIKEIYKIGGVQAVGAVAYGTESISPVLKILGPGGSYVSAAKKIVSSIVDTGLPAGPSESAIIADKTADFQRLAFDVMTEAEHGSDSAALLLTPDNEIAIKVLEEVVRLLDSIPEPRRGYIETSIFKNGGIFITGNIDEAVDIVNLYAPEHLSIQTADPESLIPSIRNAGEILLGAHTPFSLANYAAGPNAVLPTGGWARLSSPVSVRDFVKSTSVVRANAKALGRLRETVISFAEYEDFPAHAAAVRNRPRG